METETPRHITDSDTPSRTQTAQEFYRHFQGEVTALQAQISSLPSTSPIAGERLDAAAHTRSAILGLARAVQDVTESLSKHDRAVYAKGISELQERLEEYCKPRRKKFAFKTRRVKEDSDEEEGKEIPEEDRDLTGPGDDELAGQEWDEGLADLHREKTLEIDETDHSGATITLPHDLSSSPPTLRLLAHARVLSSPPSSTSLQTATLSSLRSSLIDLSTHTFATLTLRNISRCVLLCGDVHGAAHITGLKQCIVVVACRQVRIHECENVDVYLDVRGRPIVEDVKGVRVAPLPNFFAHALKEKDGLGAEGTGGDTGSRDRGEGDRSAAQNMWNQVDDFKWLKSEASPNWSVLTEEGIVREEVWREFVGKDPAAHRLEETLEALGLGVDEEDRG